MGPVLKFHGVGTSLMRNFDIYFSQRWSFLFPDTRLTQRRLSESYALNWFQDFLHRGFHDTLRLFEISNDSDSCETQPNCGTVFTTAAAFLSSLPLRFWDVVALLWLFICLFINLVMRKKTLVSCLTTRFIFMELALGRMPLFTRRSRTSTSQIRPARLSKNEPMVTFASDTSLPRHTSTS